MKYKIEHIPAARFAYMRRVGAYGPENYTLMANFKTWLSKKGLFTEDTVIYGVPRDNPEMTAPQDCRYDVGIVIANGFIEPEINIGSLFSGGRYLIFQIEHTTDGIQKFWSTFGEIMQHESFSLDVTNPILERYPKKLVDDGLCEMCVPII